MRIIALPLTSAVRGQKRARASDTPEPLIYFHFQQPPPSKDRKANLLGRVTGKAAEVWAGFGQAPENTWKVSRHHGHTSLRALARSQHCLFANARVESLEGCVARRASVCAVIKTRLLTT